MRRVIAVTGLSREGLTLRGADVDVIVGGGDAAALALRLEKAVAGAAGLISFGMAGALDPALQLGDWVIGEKVIGSSATACDLRWSAALANLLPSARRGLVHADGGLIASVDAKRALWQGGAIAADMESHIVGAVASRAGLPFAILRCISDEADKSLPPAIAVAMRPGGGLDVMAILRSILGQPSQLPALIRTSFRFNRAYGALQSGAKAAGSHLGYDLR